MKYNHWKKAIRKIELAVEGPAAAGEATITTRLLHEGDVPALMALTYDFTLEFGVASRYDAEHNAEHMSDVLERGIGIGVCEHGKVVGAALFVPIDTGYEVPKDAMETAHVVVHRNNRSMNVVRALFMAVRRLANATGLKLLMHQISYPSALSGSKVQTERVEQLYKYFVRDGSYGITYVCRPDSDGARDLEGAPTDDSEPE